MSDITKCDKCSKAAVFHIDNPSAANQDVCELHLPWIYNINALPQNVTKHVNLDIKEKVKDESRENTNKTSSSSTKQNNAPTGPVSTGSTGAAKDNS